MALWEVPKTTISFPAASCAMIAVQICYALGHGDVIGQLFSPVNGNCDMFQNVAELGCNGVMNRAVLE